MQIKRETRMQRVQPLTLHLQCNTHTRRAEEYKHLITRCKNFSDARLGEALIIPKHVMSLSEDCLELLSLKK